MKEGDKLPNVVFKVRSMGAWFNRTTKSFFKGKRVILFSLPGAFTPICSNQMLPNYEKLHKAFKEMGIDQIYCMSVNDSFVMTAWAADQKLKNIKVIPDGNCEFTEKVGMVCVKDGPGFGKRSWRYSAIINDGVVEKVFEEPGKGEKDEGSVKTDPYTVSSPEHMLLYLQQTDPRHNQDMRGIDFNPS